MSVISQEKCKAFKRSLKSKTLEELNNMQSVYNHLYEEKFKAMKFPACLNNQVDATANIVVLAKRKLDAINLEMKIRKEKNFIEKLKLKRKQRFSKVDEELWLNN